MKTIILFILSLALSCLAKGPAPVRPTQLQSNSAAPLALIESVAVDGRVRLSVPPPGRTLAITMPPGSRQLEIAYGSPNFATADGHFRYRMNGLDANWVDAGNGRRARYARLPAGQYRFEVVAANTDGVWNLTGSAVDITVQSMWSRIPVATLAALLLAVIGVIWFLMIRRGQGEKRT